MGPMQNINQQTKSSIPKKMNLRNNNSNKNKQSESLNNESKQQATTRTGIKKFGINTRSQSSIKIDSKSQQKRKADSPMKDSIFKRSAFGDITNALVKTTTAQDAKFGSKKISIIKPTIKVKEKATAKPTSTHSVDQPLIKAETILKKVPLPSKPKVITIEKNGELVKRKSISPIQNKELHIKEIVPVSETDNKPRQSIINEDSSSDSLYVTALEEIPTDSSSTQIEIQATDDSNIPVSVFPQGVEDFDGETINDPFQVSLYAMDIFKYLKEREVLFKIDYYMEKQSSISQMMRSLLVDWMVEVQESFELNHETLYLAVKLVDLYLNKIIVKKETLQLIGAAAMFIASKYDERIPPLVDDFLYICDGAYTHKELIQMETNVLKIVDFNLGIPLSYRFLRRYARCIKLSMPTLTLARYILELSLLEYTLITASDSKLAAASLLLALKMKSLGCWTKTLEHYSGYKLEDIKDLVHQLNAMLHKKPKEILPTVRNKYSHKIFFEVAKTPLLDKLDF